MDKRTDLAGSDLFIDPTEDLEPSATSDLPSDEVEIQRSHVEQTRTEMGDTIDAIQEKLSPSNLLQQTKETVKVATVGKVQDALGTATDTVQQAASSATASAQDTVSTVGTSAKGAGSTIVETIKQNPMPAALAGIGLGWLIASARKQNPTQPSGPTSYQTYSAPYGLPPSRYDTADDGPAGQAVSQAKEAVLQTKSQAQQKAGQLGTQAQQQAQQAVGGFQRMLQQNPLAVGAIAVALGAAVGLAVPETQQEDKLMGEARDALTQKAQQTVQETAQKAQGVAQEAFGTAKEEAKKQGLGQ